MGHRETILSAIRNSRFPLDDDELARRTGITPRQAVNQVTRALATEGVVRRVPGRDGKLVNELVDDDSVADAGGLEVAREPAPVSVDRVRDGELPAGDSQEQRQAERLMLDALAADLDVALEPVRMATANGCRVEVDGADSDRTVLVECWAHQGPPKGGQRHKLLTDALKLAWLATTIYPRPRLVLCLSDPEAAAPFLPASRTWAAQALADLHITISVVDLPETVRERIREAQRRQSR